MLQKSTYWGDEISFLHVLQKKRWWDVPRKTYNGKFTLGEKLPNPLAAEQVGWPKRLLCWAVSRLSVPWESVGWGTWMRDVRDVDPGLSHTRFLKAPKAAALLQLSPRDPGLFFQAGLDKHSRAMQCSHPAALEVTAALSRLCPLRRCRSRGLWADGSVQGSHTKLILIKFPVKSMSEFPTSSRGAGSAADNSSLLSPGPAFKHMCFHPCCEGGEFQRLAHSLSRTVTTNGSFSKWRLCFRRGS